MRRLLRAAACLVPLLTSCDSHFTLLGAEAFPTATPIKHLVVIYGENISFDHYFGTYPEALNPAGEPRFTAATGTPAVAGLTPALLNDNPNFTNPAKGVGASNPFRLDRSEAATADQDHGYTAAQLAYDGGAADLFPRYTGNAGLVMGYYDGNTDTALWNYAQHFAMSDNAYGDQYGPSTPGAITLISGQTNGFVPGPGVAAGTALADGQGGFTLIGDLDPAEDDCSGTSSGSFTGRNIGDLLNDGGVTWAGSRAVSTSL
jgi:phospholipase C